MLPHFFKNTYISHNSYINKTYKANDKSVTTNCAYTSQYLNTILQSYHIPSTQYQMMSCHTKQFHTMHPIASYAKPCHATPYHSITQHTTLYLAVAHHIISNHTTPHTMPGHTTSDHTIPIHATSYHNVQQHTITLHTIPHRTIPYHSHYNVP